MSKKKNKNTLFIVLVAFLLIVYLVKVVELGKINFFLGKEEKKVALLKNETADLKLAVSQKSNLNKLEDKIQELGYAKINKIDYLTISSSPIAVND